MSDTQVLLRKISALRQRLEQSRGSAPAAAPPEQRGRPTESFGKLVQRIQTGSRHSALLEGSLRQLSSAATMAGGDLTLPPQLTSRARRILQRGLELLGLLRPLADEPYLLSAYGQGLTTEAELKQEAEEAVDPLAAYFRETVAIADVALRTVQAFPESASAQLRLCAGLEATLDHIGERARLLRTVVEQRRSAWQKVETLATLLVALSSGAPVDLADFTTLAEQIWQESQTEPIHFLAAPAEGLASCIACHSWTVAQVLARLLQHDAELRNEPIEPLLAALVHDAGMLRVPPGIVARHGPLTDGERRLVEAHARAGADMARRLLPSGSWLVDVTLGHHERLDGTGYPAGLRDRQIPSLTRLLTVCDVYAALCAPRPHRPAFATRTALTDTLLLAEKGALDRFHAERLLHLGFYPVGSVVELADGMVGVVVAGPNLRRDPINPARPVVRLLADAQGQLLGLPRQLDLGQGEGKSIVRSLPQEERRAILARRYPELV